MASFKNRWNLIQNEILDNKGERIYVEKKIKEIIQKRYAHGEIDTNSSYIYQKMDKLLNKKVYVPIWNIGNYAHQQGYINVFELHKELEEIINIYHLPRRHLAMYTKEEKKYMRSFMVTRKLRDYDGVIMNYY